MKTSINIIKLLCFTVLLFTSCSKDHDCDTTDEHSACYAGVGMSDKLLVTETKTNGKTSSLHEYDDSNRTTTVVVFDRDGSLALTTTYTYADHEFPISVHAENKEGAILLKKYIYGADGKPVSAVASVTNNPKDIPLDYQYVYSKNKLVETITPRKKK